MAVTNKTEANMNPPPLADESDEGRRIETLGCLHAINVDLSVKSVPIHCAGIIAKLTRAPGNNELIGGLKVTAESGGFAARPLGTENIYKIYAESFQTEAHLNTILAEAQQIVVRSLKSSRGQA